MDFWRKKGHDGLRIEVDHQLSQEIAAGDPRVVNVEMWVERNVAIFFCVRFHSKQNPEWHEESG